MGQIHRVFFCDLLVLFQKLNGMPTIVDHVRIVGFQYIDDGIDLVFDQVTVHHNEFVVMIVTMTGSISVIMLQLVRTIRIFVMGSRMDQDVQTTALSCRHGNHRDPQHFRKTMGVDFHSPLFHDIHHVQGHDYRLPQFQKLQSQI